jgi:hypothetical protein
MDLEIYAGRTILVPHQVNGIPHLWIVITEPREQPEMVVIVNVTTRTTFTRINHDFSDSTTILLVEDHRFISKESIVYYKDARLVEVTAVQKLIEHGKFNFHDNCSNEMLLKIQEGCLKSPHTPKKIIQYCQPLI